MASTVKKYLTNLYNKLKRKRALLIILICIITLIVILFAGWTWTIVTFPDKKVYFYESFNDGIDGWENIDAELITEIQEGKSNGSVKLASKKYLSPYLIYNFPNGQSPPDNFVWHFKVRQSSFTSNSMTLGALCFSTKPIVLIIDKEGRVGVSHHIFSPPKYASKLTTKLSKAQWQDVYVDIDSKKQQLTIYIDEQKVLSQPYKELTYPLQKVWLGTIWVGGSENYGIPLDVSFDDVTIGNKGLLPKPSFPEYVLNIFNSIISFLRK